MRHKFKTSILIRDKMVDFLEERDIQVAYCVLDKNTYIQALRNKIIEEAKEVAEEEDLDKLTYEFADLLEVIDALSSTLKISKEKILAAKKEKKERSGGFEKKHFTSFVEMNPDNPNIQYYLDRPSKYPKIS